ncbi:YitT family protein, partial [Vibrio furnissii]
MEKHTRKEDWIAILTGTFLVAQGVFFLQAGQLLTGGTAGLALLMTHFLPWSFGWLYFIANCPFYLLAWKRFG